jgi:hypothetical protein
VSHIVIALSHDPRDWISRVMAWLTHGRYTHVALVSGDGTEVIEASGMGKPEGVRMASFEVWTAKHPRYVLRKIPHPNPELVWRITTSRLGDGYDWAYLWGWLFRRNWQDSCKWVCHELIVWACEQAGHAIIEMDDAQWLTPEHLYLISQPLE